MPTYTLAQVAQHKSTDDLWMAIKGKVYNLTDFLDEHPGGEGVLQAYAGGDSTEQFEAVSHSTAAEELLEDYYVGDLAGASGGGGGSTAFAGAADAVKAAAGGSARFEGVIVVGSGLSGSSASLSAIEEGVPVILIEKEKRLGGNSVKAWAGYNGAETSTQAELGIKDSVEMFAKDTAFSGFKDHRIPPNALMQRLAADSGPGHAWLKAKGIELPVLSQNGGHSAKRTHRCTKGGAGSYITNSLLNILRKKARNDANVFQFMKKTEVIGLIQSAPGERVEGVRFRTDFKDGTSQTGEILANGVVFCTGGFAGSIHRKGEKSLMHRFRPDLVEFPTTNPPSATGDGMEVAEAAGGELVDMRYVQVHPTGFIHPNKPHDRDKGVELVLATEALRGHGGLLINQIGKRFVNECHHRDWVSEAEMKNQKYGDIYIFLNPGCAKDAQIPFVKQYSFLGLLQKFPNAKAACDNYKINYENLCEEFEVYNLAAKRGYCPSGKDRFDNAPFHPHQEYVVGIVTPLLHYVMGGIRIGVNGNVLKKGTDQPLQGLFAGGETAGGVHCKNRLAGNSLVDCVVFGRVSGRSAAQYNKSRRARL